MEEMETKEKMQALSQGSWQLLHAPIVPTIRVFISKLQPIFFSILKRVKTTMNEGEDPMSSVRASQHP